MILNLEKTSKLTILVLFCLNLEFQIFHKSNTSSMKWRYLLLLFIINLTFACRNSSKTNDCRYGKPTPVFTADQPGIQSHTFHAQGIEATEQVIFSDSLQLTLLQSGCNEIRQEFQFNLPGNFEDKAPDFWIELSIKLMQRLGNLGPNYNGFTMWAQSIAEQRANIKLAEPSALQQGFYITIDRILSEENATLVLILSDQP